MAHVDVKNTGLFERLPLGAVPHGALTLAGALLGLSTGCGAPARHADRPADVAYVGDAAPQEVRARLERQVTQRLRGVSPPGTGFAVTADSASASASRVSARFHVDGIPVEGAQLRIGVGTRGETIALGTLPRAQDAPLTTGRRAFSPGQTLDHAAKALGFSPRLFTASGPRYVQVGDALALADVFAVRARPDAQTPGPSTPWRVLVDAETGEVLDAHALAFDLDARARVYAENAVASAAQGPTLQTLPDLNAPGPFWLSGKRIRVLNCNLNLVAYADCPQRAVAKNGVFDVPLSDITYDEINAYYGVAKAMSWHLAVMGEAKKSVYGDFGLKHPLDVFVRVRRITEEGLDDFDIAGYLPSGVTGVGAPIINVGTGWEEGQPEDSARLRGLGKDADVFMHEFGHHVVYRSVKSTKEQSGGLHEGFSDYFTYAATGNTRLAEAVVHPSKSQLRRGDRSGNVSQWLPVTSNDVHRPGEFWSSSLWEIRGKLGDWKNGVKQFDKIVWDSVDALPENAGFYHGVLALVAAAKAFAAAEGIAEATLVAPIIEVFKTRGYFAEGAPNALGVPPPVEGLVRENYDLRAAPASDFGKLSTEVSAPAPRKTEPQSEIVKRSGVKSRCGVVVSAGSDRARPLTWPAGGLTLVLLLSPLALPWARSRKRKPR